MIGNCISRRHTTSLLTFVGKPAAALSFDGGEMLKLRRSTNEKRQPNKKKQQIGNRAQNLEDAANMRVRELAPRWSNPDALAKIADIFGCSELSVRGEVSTKTPPYNAIIRLRNGSNEKCDDMAELGWQARCIYENLVSSQKQRVVSIS